MGKFFKQIDFLLLYEHKEREMKSLIVIKDLLEKKGYTVQICQVGMDDLYAQFFIKPKVLVLPWLYDNEDLKHFGGYLGGNCDGKLKIVNLHHEQLVIKNAIDFCLPSGKAKDVYHFVWGNYYRQQLINGGVKEDFIKVTGSPRLDFSIGRYGKRDKRSIAETFNLNSCKNWILIVGNFTWMNIKESEIKSIGKRGIKKYDEWVDISKESYYEVLKWLQSVEDNKEIFENVEIIYRPHPNESITAQLNEFEKRYSNFHIIRSDGIGTWYQCCDIAFTWCSTSSVEAVCAGIPIIAINPIDIPKEYQIDLIEKLNKISSKSDFLDILIRFLNGEEIKTNKEFIDEISYYFNDAKGGNGCENTVKNLIEIIENGSLLLEKNKNRTMIAIGKLIKYFVKRVLLFLGIYQFTLSGKKLQNDMLEKQPKEC